MEENKNKLPAHAKMVFKGVIFEIWQWEQKMYDGTTQVFESLKRPDTVEIVAVVGDKIILQEQEQPDYDISFLSLPSGRADGGGTAMEEAKRELLEETGHASNDWELVEAIQPYYKTAYTIHVFIARNCQKQQEQTLDSGEKISLRLITFDEMLMLSEEPRFRGAELVRLFLRLRLEPKMRDEFRKKLFSA